MVKFNSVINYCPTKHIQYFAPFQVDTQVNTVGLLC